MPTSDLCRLLPAHACVVQIHMKVEVRSFMKRDRACLSRQPAYASYIGPDICGPGTKKVHVIFNYKGKNVLINKDIRCKVCLG